MNRFMSILTISWPFQVRFVNCKDGLLREVTLTILPNQLTAIYRQFPPDFSNHWVSSLHYLLIGSSISLEPAWAELGPAQSQLVYQFLFRSWTHFGQNSKTAKFWSHFLSYPHFVPIILSFLVFLCFWTHCLFRNHFQEAQFDCKWGLTPKWPQSLVLRHNPDRHNPDRTEPGQTQPGQDMTRIDTTRIGHNPDTDITRTQT